MFTKERREQLINIGITQLIQKDVHSFPPSFNTCFWNLSCRDRTLSVSSCPRKRAQASSRQPIPEGVKVVVSCPEYPHTFHTTLGRPGRKVMVFQSAAAASCLLTSCRSSSSSHGAMAGPELASFCSTSCTAEARKPAAHKTRSTSVLHIYSCRRSFQDQIGVISHWYSSQL
ncbi:uncharacterized protein LOC144906859 [Branchiostoma floridae x Branchiostoma belcheri]